MKIEKGINPNCSESVFQLCGVTKEIAQEMKEEFIERASSKYAEDYLKDYATGLFVVQGKYHLGLYDYDGGQQLPDLDLILKIAESYPDVYWDSVSHCSEPIDDDDSMERHIKWRKDYDASERSEAD